MSSEYGSVFGGVGLVVDQPGWRIRACPVRDGRAKDRLTGFGAEHQLFAEELLQRVRRRFGVATLSVVAVDGIPPHVGLGSKTSLGMALLRACAEMTGIKAEWQLHRDLLQRGGASGIGINVDAAGGIILDGGHPASDAPLLPSSARARAGIPVLLARLPIQPQAPQIILVETLARADSSDRPKADSSRRTPRCQHNLPRRSPLLSSMTSCPVPPEGILRACGRRWPRCRTLASSDGSGRRSPTGLDFFETLRSRQVRPQ
jgi:beta-ribofuranosylaminobenzene 5'-phosphate synthase